MRKIVIGAALAGMLALAGCGNSYAIAHDHNAPTARNDVIPNRVWHFMNSPGNFQTLVWTCVGTEGYYETQDNSYPIVIVPQDPRCGYKGIVYLRPAR